MPNLNNFFRRFREHNAEREKRKKSQQQQQGSTTAADHNHLLNLSSISSSSSGMGGGGGIGGCCSRKTSSTMSKDQPQITSRLDLPGRKGSSSSSKLCACTQPQQLLPDPLLLRIFDAIENPFELVSLRRVNKAAAQYVRSKICRVTEVDLRRVRFDTLSTTSSSSSSSAQPPDTTVIVEGEIWYVHPSGCKVLCRVIPLDDHDGGQGGDGEAGPEQNGSPAEGHHRQQKSEGPVDGQQKGAGANLRFRLEALVDEQWTSREIAVLCSLVNEFRHFVRRISMDAPIFELIVANLATVDLDRWFAFQCFVKAVDEGQMNVALNKLAAQLQQQDENEPPLSDSDPDSLYWPNAKTILIRTTELESVHLARVLNYGVRSNLVMDRRRLDRLSVQVCVTDAGKTRSGDRPKQLVRNLYHFRCWAGSPGFDERFSQQWGVGGRPVA